MLEEISELYFEEDITYLYP